MAAATASASGTARRPKRSYREAPAYVVALVLGAIVLVPIGYVLLGGFRTTGQIANVHVTSETLARYVD